MRFMLDTIAALRTNNARKIPNYDPSLLEHMKKLLRGLVHSSGNTVTYIPITERLKVM